MKTLLNLLMMFLLISVISCGKKTQPKPQEIIQQTQKALMKKLKLWNSNVQVCTVPDVKRQLHQKLKKLMV